MISFPRALIDIFNKLFFSQNCYKGGCSISESEPPLSISIYPMRLMEDSEEINITRFFFREIELYATRGGWMCDICCGCWREQQLLRCKTFSRQMSIDFVACSRYVIISEISKMVLWMYFSLFSKVRVIILLNTPCKIILVKVRTWIISLNHLFCIIFLSV